MSDTKAKKKYSLVVEPHGSYEKYVVYFEYDNPKNKNLTHAFSVFEPFMNESIDAVTSMIEFLRKH